MNGTFAFAILGSLLVQVSSIPDYLYHNKQFELAAKMATSAGSCHRFGIEVDGAGISDFSADAIQSAVEDGMSVSIAESMSVAALRDEQQKQEFLLNQIKRYPNDAAKIEDALERFIEYWQDRCKSLSEDSVAGKYFVFPVK